MLVLAAVAVALVAAACGGPAQPAAPASAPVSPPAQAPAGRVVTIGHAGMLSALVQNGLTPALASRGITIRGVKGNSLTVAGNIDNGSLPADLFGSADANANQLLSGAAHGDKVRWFAVFARNAVVLAYSPKSSHFAEFEQARRGELPWYRPLEDPGVTLGRDNPDTDPLGYYDLFVAQLTERSTGQAGLAHRLLGDDRNPAQVGKADPAKLATGEVDAMFMYVTGAASAGVSYLTLPPEANLSDPAHAADYASASFTNAAGTTYRGGVINASIAPIAGSAHAAGATSVLDYLFSADGQHLLAANGFLPSPLLIGGDQAAVPDQLKRYVQGPYPAH